MNSLKIAYRNLVKSKTVTAINLFGLTLGIIVSVLLLSYVQQEKDTDKFIKDYDNIYVITTREDGGKFISRPMVNRLRETFPDIPITYATEDWAKQTFLTDDEGNSYKINHLLNADSTFFNVFQFDAVAGNPQRALDVTSQIVLRESMAKKIFGDANPIGKTVKLNTSYYTDEPVQVAAVLKDFPENSAWQFEAAISVFLNDKRISWYPDNANRWGGNNYSAFCRLPANMDPAHFQQQLTDFTQDSELDNIRDILGLDISIVPYSQLYLHSPKLDGITVDLKRGNHNILSALQLIALLILLMACVNYVNLVSAQRRKRNKSVAIVKMLGSDSWNVVRLFMAEAGVMLLAVAMLSLALMPFVLQAFNGLMETHYSLSIFLIPKNILLIAGVFLVSFFITGLLPGLIFSRYEALRLIRPVEGKQKQGFVRNVLPVLQFSIAIALIACLFTIKKQNDMMLAQDVGYQKEHVLYAAVNSDLSNQSQALVNELKAVSGVADITFADGDLVQIKQNWGVDFTYDGEKKNISFDKIGVTPNFFDFFGMKLIQGHNFTSKKYSNAEAIFNQTAIREFGIEDLEKARVMGEGRIVGVVKDFNLKSAHFPIAPVAFFCNGEIASHIYIKTNASSFGEMKKTIADIEQCWNRLSPHIPFEYKFLDEEWNGLYQKEVQFQNLLTSAGWISIFIACLGLLGLSIFVAEQRTKEIGIRKVNGATVGEVLALLNTSFVKWIIIAFVIATPIAYYAMSRWLENFAYKTALSWWIFALAGLAALVVALLTVSWQSWHAATRNPVEALKYE